MPSRVICRKVALWRYRRKWSIYEQTTICAGNTLAHTWPARPRTAWRRYEWPGGHYSRLLERADFFGAWRRHKKSALKMSQTAMKPQQSLLNEQTLHVFVAMRPSPPYPRWWRSPNTGCYTRNRRLECARCRWCDECSLGILGAGLHHVWAHTCSFTLQSRDWVPVSREGTLLSSWSSLQDLVPKELTTCMHVLAAPSCWRKKFPLHSSSQPTDPTSPEGSLPTSERWRWLLQSRQEERPPDGTGLKRCGTSLALVACRMVQSVHCIGRGVRTFTPGQCCVVEASFPHLVALDARVWVFLVLLWAFLARGRRNGGITDAFGHFVTDRFGALAQHLSMLPRVCLLSHGVQMIYFVLWHETAILNHNDQQSMLQPVLTKSWENSVILACSNLVYHFLGHSLIWSANALMLLLCDCVRSLHTLEECNLWRVLKDQRVVFILFMDQAGNYLQVWSVKFTLNRGLPNAKRTKLGLNPFSSRSISVTAFSFTAVSVLSPA